MTIRVPKKRLEHRKVFTWCLAIPPRCEKYKTYEQTVYENETLIKKKIEEDCCDGYTKSNIEDICIPVCSNGCLHGTCIEPEKCKCEVGYGGSACNICERFFHSIFGPPFCSDSWNFSLSNNFYF